MKVKQFLTIALTKKVLIAIEKIIKLRCSIKGMENIPLSSPIIFTPNHFTRFETFLLPYFLNKIDGLKFCRSLADSSLFTSYIGKYLQNLKTLSTHDENRDTTIISDLAEYKNNWVIYPEGMMVKDRKRNENTGIVKHRSSIKTGTVVLAIKAEMLRQKNKYPHPICIVPTTISYIPINPQENSILKTVQRFIKKIPQRLEEELLVEGSLLLNSQIIIHFHKPIYITDYIIKESYIHKIFNITQESIENINIAKYRIPITMKIADEIYKYAQITHEHIISLILANLKNAQGVSYENLPYLLILCAIELQKHSNIQEFHENLKGDKIFKYILNNHQDIDTFLTLLEKQELIRVTDNTIFTTEKFHTEYDFNTVRIQNITKIFLNEINYFENTESIAISTLKMKNHQIMLSFLQHLHSNYLHQHKITYNSIHSIQTKYGSPFFIDKKTNRALLLIHGYKSSPMEVYDIGEYIAEKENISCYGARMAGHGTSPFDMANTTYEDWVESCEIAYKTLKIHFNQVDILGFSTGGLVATQIAEKYKINKLILINSALELCDIRFRFIKFATLWSDVASKISQKYNKYIKDTPFYPDTNYSINHFSSMNELSKLMEKAYKSLKSISSNTLIIHSENDPVVKSESGKIIFDELKSSSKSLEMIESDQHVITRGSEVKKIQNIIAQFLIKNF